MVLIVVGFLFFADEKTVQGDFALASFVPTGGQLILLVTGINAFVGLEVTSVFVRRIRDPRRTYPRAIFVAASLAFGLLFLVTLVIMIAVPPSQLNVVSGFMETFEILFDKFSLGWLVPVIAALITVGWIGRVTNIFIGPATGLLAAARYGHLPEKLTVENKRSAPRNMLVAQAIIATVASVPFALLSNPQAAFTVLATMAVSIYLVMFVMMYISAIRLRYTRRDVTRPFRIPGGNAAMWAVAGLGIVSASFALVLGLAPPAGIFEGIRWLYPTMILGGVVVAVALGLVVDRGGEAPTEVRPHVVADVGEAGESFLDDTADLDTPDLDVPTESGAD